MNESTFGAYESDSSFTCSTHSLDDSEYACNTLNEGSQENDCLQKVSFLSWNIEGLTNKLFDKDFVCFVSSCDFVCLTETFLVDRITFDIFPDHNLFYQPAVKLTHQGRPSGGVMCLVKKVLAPLIKQIKVDVGNFILLTLDKTVLNVDKDVLYVCAYVPPEGSQYYNVLNLEKDGVSLLENCLVDNVLLDKDVYIIVNGDLNSRTSNISQSISFDPNHEDFLRTHVNDDPITRKSQDKTINSFGKSLLSMCTALDLCILNGTCNGDRIGRFTYICDSGSSVDDYFLMSGTLYANYFERCHLEILDRTESKHLPIKMSIDVSDLYAGTNNDDTNNDVRIIKYRWKEVNKDIYFEKITKDPFKALINDAMKHIYVNPDVALNRFNDCIKDAALCMKTIIVPNKKTDQQWFDYECIVKRREVRKSLRHFNKAVIQLNRMIDEQETRSNNDDLSGLENIANERERSHLLRQTYDISRREYNRLLDRKRKQHDIEIMDKLSASTNNAKDFWEIMHKVAPKRQFKRNSINEETWFNYFKDLLDKEDILAGSNDGINYREDGEELEFNSPITVEEVELALKELKSQKAAGPDMIIGELLKFATDEIKPFFVTFFNYIFDRGIYPENWTESIILPLYKKGDINDPSNYRGISLSDISSKVYGKIINKRIQQWVDTYNITGEQQAGFKKGYSTIDNIFTLMAAVQKQFCNNRNRKLYVAFIDFKKCFDTINRNILWPILLKNGFKGKLFDCIRSMYENVKARIRISGNKLTDNMNCTLGVKQGDICSPVLFSLYINELALDVMKNGRHGVIFDAYELFILLLADDIVLCSETVIGLQNQLNILHRSASKLHLTVNLEKSNIVVFRKGGYLGARERWMYDGSPMPVVNAYKYLGVYMSTMLSFSATCKDVTSKAKRALLYIIQRLRQYNNSSVHVFLKIFDAQIQPIMQYGSEIWGLEKAANECEKLHLYALKKFLNVDMKTPNDLVYTEMCRYPITINSIVNCIRYWLKLLEMDNHRLPKKAYNKLYDLDRNGKQTWATNIRICLTNNGFGFAWLNQGVGNDRHFLKSLKERLIDCNWQIVQAHINESERFEFYSMICSSEKRLAYHLSIDIKRHLKCIFSKFRFGVTNINTHYFRYRQHNQGHLLCPYCKDAKEDEVHFVLNCPLYINIRKKFIKEQYYRNPNNFKLKILFSSNHHGTIENLCHYLFIAFKIRENFCSERPVDNR